MDMLLLLAALTAAFYLVVATYWVTAVGAKSFRSRRALHVLRGRIARRSDIFSPLPSSAAGFQIRDSNTTLALSRGRGGRVAFTMTEAGSSFPFALGAVAGTAEDLDLLVDGDRAQASQRAHQYSGYCRGW